MVFELQYSDSLVFAEEVLVRLLLKPPASLDFFVGKWGRGLEKRKDEGDCGSVQGSWDGGGFSPSLAT